jgi:FtsP/CotA-like multicopper oxidase with cupredoxin domain
MRWAPLLLALVACRPGAADAPVDRSARALAPARLAPDLDPDPGVVAVRLVAEALPEGAGARFGYGGGSPGPVIRARVGDRLEVTLENRLPHPTTLHWHGLEVPFEMDGAPITLAGAPHPGVRPGETFRYAFTVRQAGTFWYHPHLDTDHQVADGLLGALVVEEAAATAGAEDLLLLLDAAGERTVHAAGAGHGRHRPRWRVNGVPVAGGPLVHRVGAGSAVRARVVNGSGSDYLDLRLPEDAARWIGGDQGLFGGPRSAARVLLGPGDRAELELRPGPAGLTLTTAPYSLNGGEAHGDPLPLVTFASDGTAAEPLAWTFPGEEAPTPDPGQADAVWSLQGSDRTGRWRIAGEAFPRVTPVEVRRGDDLVLELRNVSATEHPFHLHGLVFEVLSVDGVPPPARTWEDTVNVRIRQRVRLRVPADNPGLWMAHCHILPHVEDGMMTLVRVVE